MIKNHFLTENNTLEKQKGRLNSMQKIHKEIGNGRPLDGMTDEMWQERFRYLKENVTPYDDDTKRLGCGSHDKCSGGYAYKTSWEGYRVYINDMIKNIKKGERDYCYYEYQVIELLKFFPDSLMTKFHGWYWEVWLEHDE